MKAIYKELLDNSINASLSAIEIYNKPDFKYRNEIFSILIINAWELLFKAKIIKDNNNKLNSIYVYDNKGKIKRNRSKAPLTIEIRNAIEKLNINQIIKDNLYSLIEIRDSSIHFYNKNKLQYIVYSLGVACLKNYQKLIKEWFDKDLLEYSFYILPLGFSYNFKTFTQLDLNNESKIIRDILENISNKQKEKDLNDLKNEEFFFTCEIEISLKSAKKITETTDFSVSVDNNNNNLPVLIKNQSKIDKYPLSYKNMTERIKLEIPEIRLSEINSIIKKYDIKNNKKFSDYSFQTKEQEKRFENNPNSVKHKTSIYNQDCVRFIIGELKK